jgi:hypothetical protein
MTAASKYVHIGLGTLFAVGGAVTFFLMFQAGCAGDLKSGSFGDPYRALELERVAFLPLLVSASLGGAAIGLRSHSIHRAAYGGAFALFAVACLWFAGVQFQHWGAQTCFQP